jgi:hypothetical protein
MFVDASQRVPEFMNYYPFILVVRGFIVQPAKVHGRLVLREVIGDQTVGADGRPGAWVRLKRDADLGIGVVAKVELHVSVVFPLARVVLDFLPLHVASVEKLAAQRVAVVPLLLDDNRHPSDRDRMVSVQLSQIFNLGHVLAKNWPVEKRLSQ